MIALDDVSIQFGDRVVFRALKHRFPAGAITAIRKNDVLDGGSTLLKCCAGIVPPSTGTIRINGEDLLGMSESRRYQSVCYCYERGGLVSLFSVYNNLAVPMQYHQVVPPDQIDGRIQDVAARLGISHLLGFEPFQLNDVQKRLVNLARALVTDAKVVLVDELQSGMSSPMFADVVDILTARAAQGVTVIMVTTSGNDDSFARHHLTIRHQSLEWVS